MGANLDWEERRKGGEKGREGDQKFLMSLNDPCQWQVPLCVRVLACALLAYSAVIFMREILKKKMEERGGGL